METLPFRSFVRQVPSSHVTLPPLTSRHMIPSPGMMTTKSISPYGPASRRARPKECSTVQPLVSGSLSKRLNTLASAVLTFSSRIREGIIFAIGCSPSISAMVGSVWLYNRSP